MLVRTLIALILFCCASAPSQPIATRDKLVAAKAATMDADYRGDLAALATLRTQSAALSADPSLGYLADYWSGYASHRLAMNGAGANMPLDEMKQHLERAIAGYESSFHKKSDFADGYAAAASSHAWLAAWYQKDPDAMKSQIEIAARLLAKAEELEPANPRVLWVRAAFFLYSPPDHGGNRDRAIEIYHQQAEVSKPLDPKSPLPDWGKAEAMMSLAFAHSMGNSPDLNAAADEARAALRLQPHWHYVKDILMPKIEAGRKQTSDGAKK